MQRELGEAEVIEEEEGVVVRQEVASWAMVKERSEMLSPVVLSRLVRWLLMPDIVDKGEVWAEEATAMVEEEAEVVILADLAVEAAAVVAVLASKAKEEAIRTPTSVSKTEATFPRIWTKQTKDLVRTSTLSICSATTSKTLQPPMPAWLPSASTA